ncbi:Mu-like prophage tail protein GpP [Paenibacillus dendritiformis]|uniref:contractile injection system protein, VgrG/Pvc8 family n=1 Tax=Paenibacillus dendritiformis TaxID=130049 RepID=UPI0018CD3E68|nr:contractile injection system protein, VgrG/Pvc8 family [Paenibacillus dendritiformis]MBG9792939.1 Mu-like prophage tail protein GpP [Paenibacillus dendritiformis]
MSQKQTVYTSANVVVAPYQFERLLDLTLIKQLNEHVKLSVSGIVPEERLDQYVDEADDHTQLEVYVQDGERQIVLFQGVVTTMAVQANRNVRTLTIEATSATILMDLRKKNRSYQNAGVAYRDLFAQLTKAYPNGDVVDEASGGRSIGQLIVQYQETDWQFAKRLASHVHAPLTPIGAHKGPHYYVGLPDVGEPLKLDEYNYTIRKNLKDTKQHAANGLPGADGASGIYEVTSHKLIELGFPVAFRQRTLYVARAETNLEGGILVSHYELREKEGVSCLTTYAHALSGASLFGKVLDVSKDQVKVSLHIDSGHDAGAMWFPYSTVYSSPDGSGWYCMPEVGDEVRLYFPDEREPNAFAASSVDLASSDPVKRSDPSVKSISTKYGKQVVFQPGAIEIIGNGNLLMRLTDDGGIEINSDKKIVLSAEDDIEITGGARILLQGEAGIDLKQADANLNIADHVTLSGGKVNIE